jgi:ferredoxin-NADP reductase/Na+-translocating ferredoxin:NAD+ oxidoreductase RnfD subunit
MISSLKNIKKPFATKLDAIGMYRVVSGGLLILAILSVCFGFLGLLPYSGVELVISLGIATASAVGANVLCAKVFSVHANHESAVISGLIIFFLILPAQLSELQYSWIVSLVTVLAIVSKYLIVWRKQHILNPVASGVLAVTILYSFFTLPPGYFESSWWIGQPVLFVPLLLVGIAVVAKVRKWTPVLSFLAVAFVVYLFEEWRFTGELFVGWERFWLSGPSLFLAFFMLTEPFTMPPTKRTQRWYGVIVGFLSQTTIFLPFIKMTPGLALLCGNVYAYVFRIRRKLFLKLLSKREIATDVWEFTFEKPTGFSFQAGQYLEWMLPHTNTDSRGERRYFTIASSPTEEVVRLALKFVYNGSTYKARLRNMEPGESIIASQLAGDFLLPRSSDQKLGFIAGGIGVTPFSSHIQFLKDTQSKRDVKLFYCVNTESEMAFVKSFAEASAVLALETIPVVAKGKSSSGSETGFITKEMLVKRAPDYLERHWYLSGPPPMVNAYGSLLKKVGVPAKQITKDFFPGLA